MRLKFLGFIYNNMKEGVLTFPRILSVFLHLASAGLPLMDFATFLPTVVPSA